MSQDGTVLSLGALELTKLEAVVELMYLAAYADGEVVAEERDVFAGHVVGATNGALSREAMTAMLAAIERALASSSREQRFDSIRRRLGDARTREAALRIAIHVLYADKFLDPREAAWVLRAARALEISEEDANAMLAAGAVPA